MSRRKAKKLDWVISAVASGVMAFSPMSLMAQEFGFSDPSLNCPLAENQCSEYLYEVYSRAPEFSGPTPGSTHDFPEATLAPIIPAISDDLAGHGAVTFGCGDYDRVRVSQRVELNLPRKLEDVDANLTLQKLAALDLTTLDEVQNPSGIDFQGTCYEQSIKARHRMPSVYRLMQAPTMLGDLVQHAVSDAIHHANQLREEYRPYDLVTRPDVQNSGTVDYWQAHQHLDIQAVQAPVVDYWQAHQHLDIQAAQAPVVDYWQAHQHLDIQAVQAAEFDLAIWAAAPNLLQTYATMILEHRYVQSPATLKRDLVQRIEMKLCGTPAMETWLKVVQGSAPANTARVASPTVPVSTETVLWFADLLDQTGKQFQKASSRLSQMARTAENQRQIR
jgi:hypothetical protein